MNIADQCRKMGLSVGDTIIGREESNDYWHEAELTLIFLGESTATFRERNRSDEYPEWSRPRESTSWTLAYRDWKKVEVSDEQRTADA